MFWNMLMSSSVRVAKLPLFRCGYLSEVSWTWLLPAEVDSPDTDTVLTPGIDTSLGGSLGSSPGSSLVRQTLVVTAILITLSLNNHKISRQKSITASQHCYVILKNKGCLSSPSQIATITKVLGFTSFFSWCSVCLVSAMVKVPVLSCGRAAVCLLWSE